MLNPGDNVMAERPQRGVGFRTPPVSLAPLIAGIGAITILCWSALSYMSDIWFSKDEYSHGVLIPFITLYLIWQKLPELTACRFTGSWAGTFVVLAGIALCVAGELSALYVLVQYAFLLMLYGLVISMLGWRAFKTIAVPLLILAFMIPLPNFLYNNLSGKLQLLSSELGVAVIRLFGISVFLEGNVIDLGSYKLQVVEACNGLRYLFPLMTLGFIVAYFYQAELWKRTIVFISTVPITIAMNSMRIGVIGVTVEYWGQEAAEGFLHNFEGWAIFMACFAVLFIEMWVLMRVTHDRRPLREVFGLEAPDEPPPAARSEIRVVPVPHRAATVALVAALVTVYLLPERRDVVPPRQAFADFPLSIADWHGEPSALDEVYVNALKFTDYALINYRHDAINSVVNFYVAYYESQRKGQSAHSPRSCIPGGGWEIKSLTQRELPGVRVAGRPVRVNRVLIRYGDQAQLVYYWFQQRGRVIANEYLVKWFMFWDALTRSRTDGALVRLTAPVASGSDPAEVDAVLTDFAADVAPLLAPFVPE